MNGTVLIFILSSLVLSLEAAGSSKGDQHPWFRRCLKHCVEARNCSEVNNAFGVWHLWITLTMSDKQASITLKLTQWDCQSDCKYLCMKQHNEMREEEGLSVLQYYGKWPFTRVCLILFVLKKQIFGFQEIVSSLFSLGNFIPYCWGFFEYMRKVPNTYHLKPIFLAYAICGLVVFHVYRSNVQMLHLDFFFCLPLSRHRGYRIPGLPICQLHLFLRKLLDNSEGISSGK